MAGILLGVTAFVLLLYVTYGVLLAFVALVFSFFTVLAYVLYKVFGRCKQEKLASWKEMVREFCSISAVSEDLQSRIVNEIVSSDYQSDLLGELIAPISGGSLDEVSAHNGMELLRVAFFPGDVPHNYREIVIGMLSTMAVNGDLVKRVDGIDMPFSWDPHVAIIEAILCVVGPDERYAVTYLRRIANHPYAPEDTIFEADRAIDHILSNANKPYYATPVEVWKD